MLHRLVRACDLYVVGRGDVALEHDNGALDLLRFSGVVVVGKNRNVQDVSFGRCPWDGGGDFTSVLIDLDGPRTAVIRDGVLGLAAFKRVALRGFIVRVTAQAALRELRLEAHLCGRLVGHRVIVGDLDVHDGLELRLNLIGGLIRVGGLDLWGDDAARRDGFVRLRGNPTGLIDGNGPAIRNGIRVNLKLRGVNRAMALHDGLGANLSRNALAHLALRNTWAH